MGRSLLGFYLYDSTTKTPDSTHIFALLEKHNACDIDVKIALAEITDNPIR